MLIYHLKLTQILWIQLIPVLTFYIRQFFVKSQLKLNIYCFILNIKILIAKKQEQSQLSKFMLHVIPIFLIIIDCSAKLTLKMNFRYKIIKNYKHHAFRVAIKGK